MEEIKKGRWRHYKGNDYEVLYTARHSETLEPMVVYRALYGDGGIWVRPAYMWNEHVTAKDVTVPRFTYIGAMDVTLRPEMPADYVASENVTREAFWNLFKPGSDEHYLLHVMRDDPAFIQALDFVAEKDGAIIGHIAYTKSSVITNDGICHETITFGPVSVLPAFQRTGLGARLILHTLDQARSMGYKAVIILGHPDYYPRLGFKRGRDFGLRLDHMDAGDALMALELVPGSLKVLGGGTYHYADVYNVDEAAAAAFDGTLPPKEKKATDPRL